MCVALSEIIVDRETGLLVDEDPRALANAWRTLLENPTQRAALGAAARKRIEEQFSPTVHAGKVESLYHETLSDLETRSSFRPPRRSREDPA